VSLKIMRRLKSRRAQQRALAPAFVAVERLEELQLLSATAVSNIVAAPLLTANVSGKATAASTGQATPAVTNSTPLGHTPAQIAQAYGFNQVAFSNGVQGDGAGQTIAIVDAFVDPNTSSDLQKFDSQFGLAAPPSFSQVVEQGATANSGWSLETALDVEWAHAMAPDANIVLVEANNSSLGSLLSAVNYARNLANVSVVSMSWGSSEFASETAYDSYFTAPAGHIGITFVASSGDAGAGTTWPSVSPNVLAVGGTTLSTNASGTYSGETAWSGSGGGVSTFETEPSSQSSVQSTGKRTTPDVAFDADPNSGFAVYDSVAYAGQSGWFEVGGTSAGAPQWSALVAIADQGRAISGLGSLSNAQSTLYSLPAGDFHDITSGSNGFAATTGYDLVTGRGSPVVTSIVQALSGTASTAVTKTGLTGTSTTQSTTRPHTVASSPSPSSPSNPSSPSSPGQTSPSSPDSKEGSPPTLVEPDVTPASDPALQAVAIPASSTLLSQVTQRVDPLPSVLQSVNVTAAIDDSPGMAAVPTSSASASSSFANDFAESTLGATNRLPSLSGGSWQVGPGDSPAVPVFADAAISFESDEITEPAAAFAPVLGEAAEEIPLSHAAIDALFTSNGLTQATTAIDAPAPTSSMSKTAVAGVAASVGLVSLAAVIRNRRRQAAQ
jgi:hypothetical protein